MSKNIFYGYQQLLPRLVSLRYIIEAMNSDEDGNMYDN